MSTEISEYLLIAIGIFMVLSVIIGQSVNDKVKRYQISREKCTS